MNIEKDEHIVLEEYSKFDDVDITDDFMFAYIMRKPEICTMLLECLLPGHHIEKVQYFEMDDQKAINAARPETQKVLSEGFHKRGVRLDAYLDDGKTIYNIEMQTTLQPAIAKRARLYQAHLDVNQLERGRSFDQLKPSYVIFICKFDPFGQGRYCYTFQNTCVQDTTLALKDESYKVFFNTKGTKGEISPELQQVLCYMNDTDSFPVEASDNRLILMIEQAVKRAKMNDEWRRSYMTYAILQRDAELRGEKKGITIGTQNTKTTTAKKLLQRGMPIDDVADVTELSREAVEALKNAIYQTIPIHPVD